MAYAIKANSAGTVVRAFAADAAGVDAVSGAEVEPAISCGVRAQQVVMSGVAKTDAKIDLALSRGILAVQVESVEELTRISPRALATGLRADVLLTVNPGIEIDSRSHIATAHDEAQFGISGSGLAAAYAVIGSEG